MACSLPAGSDGRASKRCARRRATHAARSTQTSTLFDELFFALYTERSALLAHHVAAGLTHPPNDIPELVAEAVQALTVDRDWILVSTDFRLYAARNPEVAAALVAHRNQLRDALATSLAPAIDRSSLPASLQTPDGLARAVMAIHDGATTELLLDNDPARFRSWLADLLTALLDHPGQTRTSEPAKHPAPNSR